MQEAHDISQGVNLGKKNEMSPAAYALDRAKEMCRKKHWEGYREFAQDQCIDEVATTNIDFNNLPLNLCFYKPDNSMGAGITKKAEAGKVWYTRKRNGIGYVLARGTGKPMLYSRRMLRQHDDEVGKTNYTWDDRFSHIIHAAEEIMPQNSILLGELVMDRLGADDFKAVQSFIKSLTQQSINDQIRNGLPSFYVWDVAFWNGEDLVSTKPVEERFALVHEIDGGRTIHPIQIFGMDTLLTPTVMIETAKTHGYEGWVVVDPKGVYGDKAYNFKGKPDRPGSFCAKLKPSYSDDFIAFWDPEKGYGERSTKGRFSGGIKSVSLYQYNSRGEMVYIANVASGLEEEARRVWADPKRYPQVWVVEYTDRRYQSQGDDTNAIDFPRFIEERTDKKVEECINGEL
jgi:hypothetical protein